MIGPMIASLLAAVSTLTVSVEPSRTLSAPRGAQHVEMLRISLAADCLSDIVVEELRLRRRGLGFSTDIEAVYAEARGLRVSNSAMVARDGSVDVRLQRFVVPACSTEEVRVYTDLAPDADVAGEHRLELAGSDSVVTSGAAVSLRTAAPSGRKILRTAGDTAARISVEYLRLLKNVRFGEDRIVMRLKLSADGSRDHLVERITVTNLGSARDRNLQNLSFRDTRGKRLSGVAASLNGPSAVLTFDPPLWIQSGGSKTLELHAAVRSGARRTIQFIIEEPGDIVARERRGRS